MRQSKDLNYEAPFLYLLCGAERAILLDTGAVAGGGVRETVDSLLRDRERDTPGYQLVVAHTHGHGDHVAGDGDFACLLDTTVIGRELGDVQAWFGFTGWPAQVLAFDLGGRALEIPARLATRTRRSPSTTSAPASCSPGTPCTRGGCTCGTCRRSPPASSGSPIHLRPAGQPRPRLPHRDDDPAGPRLPDRLPVPAGRAAAAAQPRPAAGRAGRPRQVQDKPGVHDFGDFAIYNGPCVPAVLRQIARGLADRARRKVALLIKPAAGGVVSG